jgi:hypothetical protein
MLVNVDNDTLRRILDNPEAMSAVERIEGWRSLATTSSKRSSTKARRLRTSRTRPRAVI